MEVSVSLWSYVELINSGKYTVEDVIKHIHSCNVKYVEVLDYFLPTDEKKAAAKKLIEDLGMKVSSYSIGNNFVCDEKTRLEQVEMVKKACEYAKYFNTNTIRVFCGDVGNGYDFETAFDLIVKSFKECVKVAEKENVYYCLENHGMLAGKSHQVLKVLDTVNSPNLKATTDTGNFLLVGEDSKEAVKVLKGRVGLVHFKDFKKVSKEEAKYVGLNGIATVGTVIGEGDVGMQEVVNNLKDGGFDGCLSIEYEGENSLEAVEKSIKNAFSYLK